MVLVKVSKSALQGGRVSSYTHMLQHSVELPGICMAGGVSHALMHGSFCPNLSSYAQAHDYVGEGTIVDDSFLCG